jgi:hypothetical protein
MQLRRARTHAHTHVLTHVRRRWPVHLIEFQFLTALRPPSHFDLTKRRLHNRESEAPFVESRNLGAGADGVRARGREDWGQGGDAIEERGEQGRWGDVTGKMR